jgi:DNA (cytosine-5)-methyltransferase 1
MSHVDLCSGIGGFALGFEWAGLSKPVLFCDIEPWSRKVLAKHWPDVPIAEDVKELANDPNGLIPDCDILTAGYPCQPFSVAGKQRGAKDDRHIWPEIFTIVQAKLPAWCIFENVLGHISLGLNQVLSDLESKGYAVQPFVVPACAVDAPHRRDRVWIVAYADNTRQSASARRGENCRNKSRHNTGRLRQNVGNAGCVTKGQSCGGFSEERRNGETQGQWSVEGHRLADTSENVADTDNEGSQGRLSGRQGAEWQGEHGHARCSGAAHRQPAKDWWAVEPPVGRVAHGIPGRVDRLKGLGNAIVPQIAMQIGLTIKAVHNG